MKRGDFGNASRSVATFCRASVKSSVAKYHISFKFNGSDETRAIVSIKSRSNRVTRLLGAVSARDTQRASGENVKRPNCISSGNSKNHRAPRSLILDPCNDARPPGSSFAGMIFCLSARSIPTGMARCGDHSRLPLPRSLHRSTDSRANAIEVSITLVKN
ncbi:hypothetical protein PUN28_003781 [Cardiocondyla obscurior]|uniref:Uncharacterized protein n=1 Tax=Cardiocondyla obscurior TaxID=286306 RepID=A0AAW2GLP1_9HYME